MRWKSNQVVIKPGYFSIKFGKNYFCYRLHNVVNLGLVLSKYVIGEYCNFPQIVHLFAALCIMVYVVAKFKFYKISYKKYRSSCNIILVESNMATLNVTTFNCQSIIQEITKKYKFQYLTCYIKTSYFWDKKLCGIKKKFRSNFGLRMHYTAVPRLT